MTHVCELIIAFVYLFPEYFGAEGRSDLSVKDLLQGSFMKRRHFSSFCEKFHPIIVEVGRIRSIFNQRCYLRPALRRVCAAGRD